MPASPPSRPGTFAALALRDFRFLLLGTTLSNAAQWIQQVTLGWLVYDLTGSGTALGTLNLSRALASLALCWWGGRCAMECYCCRRRNVLFRYASQFLAACPRRRKF